MPNASLRNSSSTTRPQEYAETLIQNVLNDAVQQRQLFPAAAIIRGFSRHPHKSQWQFTVQTQGGSFFIKAQELQYLPRFAAEEQSLLSILATHTLAVAAPLATGLVQADNGPSMAYLVLQHIPLAVHGDWFSAGQQLAQLHGQRSAKGYGFDRTTWCSEQPQDNRWNQQWGDFFINQRLLPQIGLLKEKGIHWPELQPALDYAAEILEYHNPPASLLHGDLWSGNIGFNPDRHLSYPVLFDPASYYGDAEVDLAVSELFGRFPQRFYEGYESIAGNLPGYEQRRPIYQLYHLFNHTLQFGGSFTQQTAALLTSLSKPAR